MKNRLLFVSCYSLRNRALRPRQTKIGEDEGKLLALENAWNRAAQAQDTKALSSLMSDSLIYIDFDGTLMHKTEFLNFINR